METQQAVDGFAERSARRDGVVEDVEIAGAHVQDGVEPECWIARRAGSFDPHERACGLGNAMVEVGQRGFRKPDRPKHTADVDSARSRVREQGPERRRAGAAGDRPTFARRNHPIHYCHYDVPVKSTRRAGTARNRMVGA
jgi:hypothetical protein